KLADIAIPASGLLLLRCLEQESPLTVSELAARLGLHPSTISTQLRPLTDLGLAHRRPDDTDRRVAWISITRSGRDACDRVRRVNAGQWAVVLTAWSDRDRKRLADLL